MEAATKYLAKARSLGASAFCSEFSFPFLVKHPRRSARSTTRQMPSFGFATTTVQIDFDPMPDKLQVVPVSKKEGNPFPERMSIGRAPNCDILIRLPLVSKVHAHLLVGSGGAPFVLRDNRASNGTYCNRKRLEEGASCPVKIGDTLGLGALDLELMSNQGFYELMRAALRDEAATA